MLEELRVENLLLIERAELRLGEGLNVLTGETGAGKTVLAHALDLLLGGKPRQGIVRPGASEAGRVIFPCWWRRCGKLMARSSGAMRSQYVSTVPRASGSMKMCER